MRGIKDGKSTEWIRGSSDSFDAGTTVYVTAEKTDACHSHVLQWKNLDTGDDWGSDATISFTLNENMRFSVTAPY